MAIVKYTSTQKKKKRSIAYLRFEIKGNIYIYIYDWLISPKSHFTKVIIKIA